MPPERLEVVGRAEQQPHRGPILLVLGITGLAFSALGALSCAVHPLALFLVVGLALSALAWLLGSVDMARIRTGSMEPSGRATTQAARTCGIVGTALCSLFLCVAVSTFLFSFLAASRWFDQQKAPEPVPSTGPPTIERPGDAPAERHRQ
jgi:hypothetical protein